MSNKTTITFLLVFLFIISALFMKYYFYNIKEQPHPLRVLGNPGQHVQPFSFINQEGKTITNETMNGKISIVNFFFATCKGICPKMNENMSKVYKAYKGNHEVLFLSHTVDPELDTVAALAAYGRRFDADPKQWMFLTGDKKKLYDMARYSYLLSAEDDTTGLSIDQDFIHDQHLVLIDRTGHLRGKFYDGLEIKQVDSLITAIGILLKEK